MHPNTTIGIAKTIFIQGEMRMERKLLFPFSFPYTKHDLRRCLVKLNRLDDFNLNYT